MHGLHGVSSLCHIARCQRQLVTMYGFRWVAVMDFFPPFFSLIFLHHFHHPFHLAIWFQSFACLIREAIFHLTLAFVLICLSLSFCHKLLSWPPFFFFFFLSFFLFFSFFLLFCRRHLRSVSFSACLALVLVSKVSAYPSSHFLVDSAWCRIFGDFLS